MRALSMTVTLNVCYVQNICSEFLLKGFFSIRGWSSDELKLSLVLDQLEGEFILRVVSEFVIWPWRKVGMS